VGSNGTEISSGTFRGDQDSGLIRKGGKGVGIAGPLQNSNAVEKRGELAPDGRCSSSGIRKREKTGCNCLKERKAPKGFHPSLPEMVAESDINARDLREGSEGHDHP